MTPEIKNKLSSPVFTAPLLVIFVLFSMQASRFALGSLQTETSVFAAIGVIQLVALGLPCMLYYLLKGRKLTEPMLVVSHRGTNLIFLVFSAVLFISGTLLIKYFYFVFGGEVAAIVNYYDDFSGTVEGAGHLEIILSLIVIPAICEEFLFRGIILSEYRKYGTVNAVVISSLCFAMLHFSPQNMLIYLFAGLLLGTVTAVTRSILPSVALHLLSNALSIYASDAFLRITVVKNGAFFIGFVLVILTGISLLLVLSRAESIFYSYAQKPPIEFLPPKSSENLSKVFLSPTFLLLTVVFISLSLWG